MMTQHTYDTLMDRLAELAMASVQWPERAVQAYWLHLATTLLQQQAASALSLRALIEAGYRDTTIPGWARLLAPQALIDFVHDGMCFETTAIWPSKTQKPTWENLACYGDTVLRVVAAYEPYISEIGEYACRLWQLACRLYGQRLPNMVTIPEEVLRGCILYEGGFYFACHEYFETLWGRTADVASDFYQGLIQVAVAMRHLESHNVRGAITLLHYGISRLQRYPACYKGLNLSLFLECLQALLVTLEHLPQPALYQFDPLQVPSILDHGA